MHGRNGAELLKELRKTKWLPPYRVSFTYPSTVSTCSPCPLTNEAPTNLPQDTTVRAVATEIKELLEPFLEIMQNHRQQLTSDPSYTVGVIVFFRSIQRNKRVALAYLMNRIRRILDYRWQVGPSASSHLSDNMSAQEREFLTGYNRLLGEYSNKVGLDLTADLQPPKDLFVEVRVKRDCGEILTDSGPVSFKPGTAHFLRRSDVEHLIRQGALEHVV